MKRFKISVEKEFPYLEMKLVLDFIIKKGYSIKLVDNGNIVCELIEVRENGETSK